MYIKYLVCLLLVNICLIMFIINKNIVREYSSNLFYMDTYINIKINSNNKKNALEGLDKAEDIFRIYHNLTDRYNSSSELYLVNHTNGEVEVDERLYDLIKYAYDWYEESNGLFNINMGDVIDIWKKYRDKLEGIPTNEELASANINIDNIKLLDNNTILNNGGNIDLGGIVKGYVTKIVGEEFKKLGISDYIINAGGNVLVGKKNKDVYKVGVESPLKDGSIYQVVKGENISVVTSGSYERFYEYEGKLYHHIINPYTLYPSSFCKSVTVISHDSALADVLSTTLFLMSVEDGQAFLKKFDDVEAIWFVSSDQIVKTEGFNKYE